MIPFSVAAQPVAQQNPYVQLQLPEATKLTMSSVFANHMLFQQKKPIGVWGVDIPGTTVHVSLSGSEHFRSGQAIAGADGYWRVELDPLDASYEEYTLTISGSSIKTYNDVVIGELFLAAGQSNMYLKTNTIIGGTELINDNTRKHLRMLWMPANPADNRAVLNKPQFSYNNCRWATGISSSTISDFSAVAYTYARSLFDQLNQNGNEVPVGIIDISLGSMLIEMYLSRRVIEENPEVKAALTPGFYKSENAVTNDNYLQITSFYNAKIAPLSGFALRGFLYYQAESNNAYPQQFGVLLDAMIKDWSATFGSPDKNLPFICVHIAPHNAQLTNGSKYTNLADEKWAGLNEAIDKVCRNNSDCMAQVPIYDIDPIADSRDYINHPDSSLRVPVSIGDHAIHPLAKRPVGERCAEVAMGLIYGKDNDYIAPTVRSVTKQDGKLLVTFDHVGDGLKIGDGTGVLRGFSVCGADNVYVEANARIVSADTVEVSSDFLTQPLNVRYAFRSVNVTANLCNSAGMPAVPFRLDQSTSTQFAKDWALCDDTKVWIDTGTFFTLLSLDEYTCSVTPLINLPFDIRGSGYYDAFVSAPISGANGTFETVSGGTSGLNCIRYAYGASADGVTGFGPVLQYTSQNNTFHELRYIAFDLANPDSRAKQVCALQLQAYDGTQYTVSLTGETALPAGGAFYTFTADLNTLTDASGNLLTDAERTVALQKIKHLQFTVQDSEAGSLLFDNIRFGTPDSDILPAYLNAAPTPDDPSEQEGNSLLIPLIAGGLTLLGILIGVATALFFKKKKTALS